MTIEQLHEAYDIEPFRPFTVHLDDGRRIPVRTRWCMCIAPDGTEFIVQRPKERYNVIELARVAKVEFKANGGGRKTRKR